MLALAAIGLPLMLSSHLSQVLLGMVLVGVGTFFAQASATGFVGQAARHLLSAEEEQLVSTEVVWPLALRRR